MINWNSEPYNDDFDENKRFVKILFRPSKAVQTRELNQLQTILQNQISRHGDHIFKNGAMVIPGQISVDNKIGYVKLRDINLQGTSVNTIIQSLVGQNILNESGLKAEVIFATERTSTEPATLFVRYVTSGEDQSKVFGNGEELSVENPDINPLLDLSVVSAEIDATGIGSICSIERGVYYVNGFFVLVLPQTIVLEKYSNVSTYRVGLKVEEEIVKPEEDETLLDNSQGSPNFAAPGAHRYRVDLVLQKRDIDSEDDKDFVELLRINEGKVAKEVRSTEYSVLETTLARRTYDESGDYVVSDFAIDVREDRDNNRKEWQATTEYRFGDIVSNVVGGKTYTYVCRTSPSGVSGTQAPTHTEGTVTDGGVLWNFEANPQYNRGINQDGSDDKFSIGIEKGKAYVQGYEIEKIATQYIKLDKSRAFNKVQNAVIPANLGNYVYAHTIVGAPRIDNFSRVNLIQNIGGNDTVVGTCRIRGLEYHGFYLGFQFYKLFIFDVILNSPSYLLKNTYKIEGTNFSCRHGLLPNPNFAILEPQNNSLIYPLPYYAIRSVDQNETLYSVTQRMTASVETGSANISIAGSGGVFASTFDAGNYIVFDHTGTIINPTLTVQSETRLDITGLAMPNNSVVTVLATIKKSGGRRSKTLVTHTVTKAQKADAQSRLISLGKADGYRLIHVKMDPSGFNSDPNHVYSYTLDITDRYTFDDGQVETHYDLAKVKLKGSYVPPSGPIQIQFEYFEHGIGDYFTKESYENQVEYKNIPMFKSTYLRDCFDFRPRISDDGVTFSQAASLPKRGVDIYTDFEYYLARKAKLCLNNLGNFFIVDGEPALTPGDVKEPALSMVLYDIELEPYTFTTTDTSIILKKIDNRRYTMRDIGKLEKRIDNLEYYTTLSLLEQETSLAPIVDEEGLDRFKNGFIVDNFTGHGVGDTTNSDYLCSVDMENGELRPFFAMNNMNLVENARSDIERNTAGYKYYGDVITLPVIDHTTLVEQPYASRVENVNPFAIFTFLGTVNLSPFSDEWFETERRPDIVNNVEGNFSSVLSLAESTGVLGTVWNAWQTTWTGTTVTGRSTDTRRQAAGWPIRRITTETFTQTGTQSRTGVRTSVTASFDRQLVEDRVVSTALLPFIRSRNILVQVKALKPNTVFYSYFDEVNVTQYCTPSTYIEYIQTSSISFDASSNSGKDAREAARQINGDSQFCLNTGDVIRSGSNTAVVIGKHEEPVGNSIKRVLHVVNIKGSFSSGNSIVGSLSGATGTVVSVTTNTQLKAAFNGDLNFVFNIPNTNSVRFRAGAREFKLIDHPNNGEFTSKGTAIYQAQGTLETKQATFNSVRNAQVVRENVAQSTSVTSGAMARVVADTGWYDPLAQTFLVDSRGGAFITKVDVFFSSKDTNIPVNMEIREVVNGYPGKRVLPFSRVSLSPSEVNISKNMVRLDGSMIPKYDTPTTFTFKSPVYVNDNQEYCVVLLSDSNKYKVWISQMGDLIPDSTRSISEQPYAGVLFKSQNASTWTADQYQDLKFKIYKAKFDISKNSQVTFINDLIPSQLLENDPIEFASGSSIIRVFQKDHGFKPGDSVTISGVSGTVVGGVETVNGIPVSEINKTHVIPVNLYGSSVQLDSYMLQIGSATATTSGYFGGSEVRANRNYRYDSMQPIVSVQNLPETTTTFTARVSNYVDGILEQNSIPVLANETNTFYDQSKVIKNGQVPSCYLTCTMTSSKDYLSPVIDTHRTSLVLVSNKVDYPTEDNYSYAGFDPITWKNGSEYVQNDLVHNDEKVYRVVAAHTASSAPTHTNTSGTPYAYIGEYIPFYLPDTAPSGAANYSNYVTKRVRLLNPSTLIKIKFAANVPAQSDVHIYYRTTNVGSTEDINLLQWIKVDPEAPITKVENGNSTFYDVSYMTTAASFDSLQLKVVLKSTNPAAVPRVKDLRIIACA